MKGGHVYALWEEIILQKKKTKRNKNKLLTGIMCSMRILLFGCMYRKLSVVSEEDLADNAARSNKTNPEIPPWKKEYLEKKKDHQVSLMVERYLYP